MKIGSIPNWALPSVALFAIAFAVSTNAQPASKQAVQEALNEMGYNDIFISKCWINFAKDTEPSEQNGWTSRYIRYVNLDYFKGFSDREIQQIGQGQSSFYGFETRLDANYPLRPLSLTRFKNWVESSYPGTNWPNVRMSRQRTSLPEIEAYLTQQIPNIDQLNRWVFMTEYGENTQVDQFFQMTWSEREPLQKFLVALKDYGNDTGCDVEN